MNLFHVACKLFDVFLMWDRGLSLFDLVESEVRTSITIAAGCVSTQFELNNHSYLSDFTGFSKPDFTV